MVSVEEGSAASLTVLRQDGSGGASVRWVTVSHSATTSDFTNTTGTVFFSQGEFSKIISIAITEDTIPETDEVFYVRLFDPVGEYELSL